MKKISKKLTLVKEIVCSLNNEQMTEVNGGRGDGDFATNFTSCFASRQSCEVCNSGFSYCIPEQDA